MLRLVADAVGSQWLTFRAQYEFGRPRGSGLDEALLTRDPRAAADAPLRPCQSDARTVSPGRSTSCPNDLWTFSASAGFGKDDYDDSYFGLQESDVHDVLARRRLSRQPNGFGAGASYNYENYTGLQQSR